MANIQITGKVTGREGESPVTVRQAKDVTIASFNVRDTDYAYFKNKDDNPGQFYHCEVVGRQATIVAERINRGDDVTVYGQPVWRQYQGKKFLDIKNCRVQFIGGSAKKDSDSDPF
jgi:single-stranded DNA-binding protein